ncbi:argonaute-like protein [Flammula alnicola]|nr:argonaute-like protein [Flammula alnicola]
MPPRNAPGRGGPGRGRGNTPPLAGGRGGGAGRGSRPGGPPSAAAHVNTIGVRRPGFGTAGRAIRIKVNSFELTHEDDDISHYDVVDPERLPARFKMELFKILQSQEPNIFTPKIVYDGQKNAFAPRELDLGETNSRKFPVSLPQSNGGGNPTRPPRVYYITLTRVATRNTETLHRYYDGQQSFDETISTLLQALNVVVRMQPNLCNPFRARSFFTPADRQAIGGGLEVWRGIFQSVRPGIGRLVLNIDLATTVMYKEGPLVELCNDFFGRPINSSPAYLSPTQNFPDQQRIRLKKFLRGVRIVVPATTGQSKPRVITDVSSEGANTLQFTTHAGATMTVAQYFQSLGRPLRSPTTVCAQVGASAMIPLEMCMVLRGQFLNKETTIPEEKVKDILQFSTKKPHEKLELIKTGMRDLQHGQSDYVRQFGMEINPEPLEIGARIINPPSLKYSGQGRQAMEANAAEWRLEHKFFKSSSIARWMVVIYDTQRNFNDNAIRNMIGGFLESCASVGIAVQTKDPLVKYQNGQGNIEEQLKGAGGECMQKLGGLPSLIVVVLPEGGNDIYTAVKHFGDVTAGVATQCLKAKKCSNAKPQYWANVMLKVNVKLGGINAIPESTAVEVITDPNNPAIVIGADVIHPPPGAQARPSFTAVVGSVDSNAAKYVATSRVQTGRQEIIDDLKEMCMDVLKLYMSYHELAEKKGKQGSIPKRLIFYRDGVSEGQFQHVLDLELPLIKGELLHSITLIVVGKRHHNQFFPPAAGNIADRSGNCPAGTVVDTDITHPTEFDFILQSHAGLLGTSRPAHYSVLHDEIGFGADALQALSFALCHVYARSTRSVSIPAPVYYADIVCSRSKNHYNPRERLNLSDTSTQASGPGADLEAYKAGYRPIHANQQRNIECHDTKRNLSLKKYQIYYELPRPKSHE